jgi:hypothetical protein
MPADLPPGGLGYPGVWEMRNEMLRKNRFTLFSTI